MVTQIALLILFDIHAVKQYSALRRFVKAQQKACQRCLACTGSTHKGHLFTGSDIKIKMLQYQLILQITEGYILKGNAALNITCSNRIRRIVNLHLMLHHLIKAVIAGHTALVHFRKHQQTENRFHKDINIKEEGNKIAERQLVIGNHHTTANQNYQIGCVGKKGNSSRKI